MTRQVNMDIEAAICGLGIGVIILIVLSYLFWLWMFIEALKKRDTLWIALFIIAFLTGFLSWLVPLLYYFIEYRKKDERR
ncbi:MAG: hypothetical protein V1909_03305 [Candidatus Micrarchaeota archaeon]